MPYKSMRDRWKCIGIFPHAIKTSEKLKEGILLLLNDVIICNTSSAANVIASFSFLTNAFAKEEPP